MNEYIATMVGPGPDPQRVDLVNVVVIADDDDEALRIAEEFFRQNHGQEMSRGGMVSISEQLDEMVIVRLDGQGKLQWQQGPDEVPLGYEEDDE